MPGRHLVKTGRGERWAKTGIVRGAEHAGGAWMGRPAQLERAGAGRLQEATPGRDSIELADSVP